MLYSTIDLAIELGFRFGLWMIFRWLNKLTPYIRHIDEEEIWYYRYPLKPSLCPKIFLYLAMLCVPGFVYLVHYLVTKGDKSAVRRILSQLYGLSLAYCINAVFTSLLKILVGRPRPNYYLTCFPDGYGTNINDECSGAYEKLMEARKSFPSAHSSFAFTGMVFVTLHIFNMIDFNKYFLARGVVFVLALLPIMLAASIAISRTCDYNHHYTDVIGGGLIGTMIATSVFYLYSREEEEEDKEKKT